ncbi:MAG TPA: hypothetical protein VMG12_23255 [Polyangiaceae bacterium]|nr:hypothetical protein [Polyangiaceae bacterium]
MTVRWSPPRCTRSALAAGRLLVLFSLAHCQQPVGVELLRVDAVSPAEAQFGDSVQVLGDGFALGSPASVRLRGVVHRAGRPPEPIEHSFRAQIESQRELVLPLPREAEAQFCGDADRASHATFRGDVEVAIAARPAGAPPATGTLHGAVVELYPAVKTRGAEDWGSARGREMLAFLGIDVAGARAGGLEVLRLAPGSRAAAAGVLPGDVLIRAAGVSVLQPSDLVPDAAREVALGVRRGDVELDVDVNVDGFTPRPPRDLGWAALPILAAVLWFLVRGSPLSRLVGWLSQNWLEQERARRRAATRAAAGVSRGAEWPHALELAGGASGLLVWLAVGAALSAPLIRREPVDVTLGLSLSLIVAAALLVAQAFAAGGEARPRWSLASAFAAAFHQWATLLPAGFALLAMSLSTGSELDDVARGQGAWPWQWNAFRGPGPLIACAALLLTCLPRPGKPAWRLAHARAPRLSWSSDGEGWFDRLYLCSASALATLLFFGGDALPDLQLGAGWLFTLGAAATLLTKYTSVVLALSFLRGLCAGVSAEQWSRRGARLLVPAALAAFAISEGWRALGRSSPFFGWVEPGFAPACLAVVLLSLALVCLRANAAAREAGPPSLSPWL